MTEDDWCPLVSAGYWSDLRAHTGTLFLTRSRRNSFVLCERDVGCAVVDRWGEWRVTQELPMLIGPQMLDDVEEPKPAPPATLKDPDNLDRIGNGRAQYDTPSQPWCNM